MVPSNIMKKFLLCFMLLISLGLFTGCTNNINYINTKIASVFITVSYDALNLTEIGADTEEELALIKNEIEEKSAGYISQLSLKYRNIINTLNTNGFLTDNEKILYRNHLNFYSGWEGETYIIELRFYTPTAARLFMRYGGTAKSDIYSKLFTTTVEEKYIDLFTSTPGNLITTSVTEYYDNGVSEIILNNFGAAAQENFNGVEIGFMFLSSNPRVHSNGYVVKTNNGSLHCFVEGEDFNDFVFYKIEANRFVWYTFALTATMVFVAIGLMVIYFKKEKNEENTKISSTEKNE